MSEGLDRRELLKALGFGAAALGAGFRAATVVARTANGELVRSESEYGGHTVERMTEDNEAYDYDSNVLRPMPEKHTVFSRNVRAPDRQDRPELIEDLLVRSSRRLRSASRKFGILENERHQEHHRPRENVEL